MAISGKKETTVLFLGDIILLYFSLWVTLFFRYSTLDLSFEAAWNLHFLPFTIIVAVWILVFFISGLYEKHTLILKSRLPSTVFNAQVINSFIAIIFFYFIPYFGIAPKTNLFIYLFISFALILSWRIYGDRFLHPSVKQKGIIIGSGEEMKELLEEVNNNPRYGLEFISSIDLDKIADLDFQDEIVKRVYSEEVQIIAVDLKNEKVEPILPHLYNLIFSKVKFIDMYKVYEDLFNRVPLSLVRYNWFLENISTESRITYDVLKRIMDIIIAGVVGLISLILYPFVALAIKMNDGGDIFFQQERIGKNNKIIKIKKFRSMRSDSDGKYEITKVGKWLRALRIDELPQIWNVFRGDISMIGPRPEIPALVKHYEEVIPYYDIRHLIKPGLSGWAQLYHTDPPKVVADAEKTRRKLSYDLYYIKNRSFMLDFKIALKTIKTLLSRSGT
ncbi:MAG: exopolysaccharide biosynthesis polyprenyl glycosylphosphotransferase [Candidatus Zambryskibacteria bacterium]|nr:exopolysaccharide biosynthesis polyprenyl glycosylphosphotransferase [Candidatus Zambryskibacteria bacterium]